MYGRYRYPQTSTYVRSKYCNTKCLWNQFRNYFGRMHAICTVSFFTPIHFAYHRLNWNVNSEPYNQSEVEQAHLHDELIPYCEQIIAVVNFGTTTAQNFVLSWMLANCSCIFFVQISPVYSTRQEVGGRWEGGGVEGQTLKKEARDCRCFIAVRLLLCETLQVFPLHFLRYIQLRIFADPHDSVFCVTFVQSTADL